MPAFQADCFHVDSFGTDNRQQVHHRNLNKQFFFDFNLFLYCPTPVTTGKFMLVIPNCVLLGFDTL